MATETNRTKGAKAAKKSKPAKQEKPQNKLSFEQMVKKILSDKKFAAKVRTRLCKAMQGNDAAQDEFAAQFALTTDDLDALCLPHTYRHIFECANLGPRIGKTNPTTFLLLSFARVM